jgi:hypothetical protein
VGTLGGSLNLSGLFGRQRRKTEDEQTTDLHEYMYAVAEQEMSGWNRLLKSSDPSVFELRGGHGSRGLV